MSNVAINIQSLSKYYRLGKTGSGRFREDLQGWFRRSRGPLKEDGRGIWALKDIDLQIEQGEVMGFVGNNGAGKSTLLKIISRITAPTSGSITGVGRIASLLEVGTGFHGELTGRENIYLNGNILGMHKKEIRARFDEIVDFSGVEKFIDTPVKRYSSGMYTRLAFAVAAHLDPEILIVDEVLAVGDAAFQRKCMGKMKEAAEQKGKTVLFVSHNLPALQNLCSRAVCLSQGVITGLGTPGEVIGQYLKKEKAMELNKRFTAAATAPGNDFIRINRVSLLPQLGADQTVIDIRTSLSIQFEFKCAGLQDSSLQVGVHLFDVNGNFIFDVCSARIKNPDGLLEGSCTIPGNFLNDGAYSISLVFVKDSTDRLFYYEDCIQFDVEDYRRDTAWFGKWHGVVRPDFPVNIIPLPNG
ncbi:MAG: ABC transporter ATP-binding protein [Chitinophagaceae bacterium]|nr:MAG: ABC transporter ATP-binding protein [Chitinophagaceae bacterium]